MIARLGGALLVRAVTRRRCALERMSRDAIRVQEATLRAHVRTARDTEFGLTHGFASVRGVADYQTRVPLCDYLGLYASWQAALAGATHVTWPGRPRLWAKISGTTAGDKVIPVTSEAYRAHRRAGWNALLMAAQRVGGRALLEGPMLMLGGSTALQPAAAGALVGDLSGVMARRHAGLRGLLRVRPGRRSRALAPPPSHGRRRRARPPLRRGADAGGERQDEAHDDDGVAYGDSHGSLLWSGIPSRDTQPAPEPGRLASRRTMPKRGGGWITQR
jgi:hypothetical protein